MPILSGKQIDLDLSKFKLSDLSKINIKETPLKLNDTSVNFRSKLNRSKTRMKTSKTKEDFAYSEVDLLDEVTLDCVNQLKNNTFNPHVLLIDHSKNEVTYVANFRKGVQEFIDDTDDLLMKKKPDAVIVPLMLLDLEDNNDLVVMLFSRLCGIVVTIVEVRKGFLGWKFNGPYYQKKAPSFIFPKFSKLCEKQKEVNIWNESKNVKLYNKKMIKEDIVNQLTKYYRGEE